ncbi:hypothetical protein BACPU_13330 [Bacillus pumilus]|nr:hypothetical protein BACPU_13330 [Bacillus pumilus]
MIIMVYFYKDLEKKLDLKYNSNRNKECGVQFFTARLHFIFNTNKQKNLKYKKE